MKTSKMGGFSLIELLVALSILAVVAAIIVPRFVNVRTQAAAATAQAQQQVIQTAVQQWLALGGTPGTGNAGINATSAQAILSFLQNTSGRTTTAGAAPADSTGTMNSSTISLGTLTSSGSSATQGFNVGTAGTAKYYDGAGNTWDILINPADGNTAFNCETSSGAQSATWLGGTN